MSRGSSKGREARPGRYAGEGRVCCAEPDRWWPMIATRCPPDCGIGDAVGRGWGHSHQRCTRCGRVWPVLVDQRRGP